MLLEFRLFHPHLTPSFLLCTVNSSEAEALFSVLFHYLVFLSTTREIIAVFSYNFVLMECSGILDFEWYLEG